MNPELILRLLPTLLFLGTLTWLIGRSRQSSRLQEDWAARQRELHPRLLDSIEMQRQGLELAKRQLETAEKLLGEVRALRAERRAS